MLISNPYLGCGDTLGWGVWLEIDKCIIVKCIVFPIYYKRENHYYYLNKKLYSKILRLMRPQADNQKEILVGAARSVHVQYLAKKLNN